MSRALQCCRWVLLAWLVAAVATAQENPHVSKPPDGSTDDGGRCAYCHDDSLGLSRTHGETCTLCHSETAHSGAAEHARASAASVARALARADDPALPLAADGKMYCGTCHLFHDPNDMGEGLLESERPARDTALNRAVRENVVARGLRDASGGEIKIEFRPLGTKYLRLPDDVLCQRCHAEY